MVARADKGNSLVILPTPYSESKTEKFLSDNNFHTTATDPTNTFQTQVRNTVKQSKTLIPKDSSWKYVNMNPSAPSIKGLIKIHKQDQPIRPIVNWSNAPAYQLSRLFTKKMNHLATLPHAFNITPMTCYETSTTPQCYHTTPWPP